jgi:YD repeat-containing protein
MGSLTNIVYSDGTPGVTLTYNRRGSPASVTDASGHRTLAYADDGRLLCDGVSFGGSDYTLFEKYDTLGRMAGYALSNSAAGASALIAGTAQTYDGANRIAGVSVYGNERGGLTRCVK